MFAQFAKGAASFAPTSERLNNTRCANEGYSPINPFAIILHESPTILGFVLHEFNLKHLATF